MTVSTTTRSAEVRARLSHPIIDGDGHTIEVIPLLLDYIREIGGPKIFEKFMAGLPGINRERDASRNRIGGVIGWWGLSPEERRDKRAARESFWRFQTGSSLDRATVMLPALYRKRLDEFGIDFSIVYTTTGLNFMRSADDEIRRVACRALNTMYAHIFGPHADRMTVPAIIPMYTPAEAIDEIDYAVGKLGMKAAVLAALVPRPIRDVARRMPEASKFATYVDAMGARCSEYDYDPVWQKCMDLKVAVTAHSGSMGFGTRTSPDNFVYNHIGHFAAAGEAICKAIVLGGVARRFPSLRFAFLEGGVGWACGLYNDLIEHWETRSVKTIKRAADPARFDAAEFAQLFAEYGEAKLKDRIPTVARTGEDPTYVPPDSSTTGRHPGSKTSAISRKSSPTFSSAAKPETA